MDHSTLNWVSDFSYDELEFEHVDKFAVTYKFFLMNDSLSMMCLTLMIYALWMLLLMLFLPMILLLSHLI